MDWSANPRPPRWVFWLVRPHKVSYKVSYNWKLNIFCRVHVDIEFNIDSASRRSSISKVPLRRLFRVICDVCRRRACTVWCSKTRFPLRPAVFSWLAGSLVILMESKTVKSCDDCVMWVSAGLFGFPAALLRLCVAAWETVTPCISMVRGVYTSRSAATRIAALRCAAQCVAPRCERSTVVVASDTRCATRSAALYVAAQW